MKKRNENSEDLVVSKDMIDDAEVMAQFRALFAQAFAEPEIIEREIEVYVEVEEIKTGTVIPVMIDEKKVNLVVSSDSVVVAGELPGYYHALFKYRKDSLDDSDPDPVNCECCLLICNRDYELFKDKPASDIKKFAHAYNQLSASQRDFFKQMYSSPKPEKDISSYEPIVDEEGLRLLYSKCIHAYSPAVQAQVKILFKELDQQRFGGNKVDILHKLAYLLNCRTNNEKNTKELTYDEVITALDKHMYGMSTLKKLIANRVMLSQHSGRTMTLLLHGKPGVGKTTVCEPIAEVFQLPYEEIKCEGTDAIALTGLVSSYGGALPSIITTAIYKHGTTKLLLLFEEIDKLTSDETKANPYAAFNSMLGPQHAFHDEFLGVDIDVSDTVIIATANDISKIPDYILNRFSLVLNVEEYSCEDKVNIAKHYIIPQLLKENNVASEDIIFEDDALHLIAKRYCNDSGARRISSCVDSLICSVVSGWGKKNSLSKPFVVTCEYVIQELDDLYLPTQKKGIGFFA